MATATYPPISPGTLVQTTKPNLAKRHHWTDEGWAARTWGVKGQVLTHHDSHGLCYDVRHQDGTEGCYDPSELKVRKAPKSYLNVRRPPLQEAMTLEGDVTIGEAAESLKKKGYFTARPGPWKLMFLDRGHGHGDCFIADRFGDPVTGVLDRADAEFIISAVNAKFKKRKKKKK